MVANPKRQRGNKKTTSEDNLRYDIKFSHSNPYQHV